MTTDQGVVSYAYDELNRLKTVTKGMGVTTYSYDDRSRLVREDRPNGTYTPLDYDESAAWGSAGRFVNRPRY